MLRLFTWPFRWFWRNRKWFALVAGSLLLLTVVTVLIVNPYGVVWGYLTGEKFYYDRPVSYWRKEFAAGWDEQRLGGVTLVPFTHPYPKDLDGSPILCKFLSDPDVNVRRMAASGLRSAGTENPAAVPALAVALTDADPWVRGLAAEALGVRGVAAREHFPALQKLSGDPDPRVSFRAEQATWLVDGDRMADAAGWVTFRSDRCRFTNRFPHPPEESTHVVEDDGKKFTFHRFLARSADLTFVVEYTDERLLDPPSESSGAFTSRTRNPYLTEFLSDAELQGGGGFGKVPAGWDCLVLEQSGTSPTAGAVVHVSVTYWSDDHPAAPDWNTMAIDARAKGKRDPVRVGMMRYFTAAMKQDRPPYPE
jgi:hypothetical protein